MTEKLTLNPSLYAEATPAGAYFAVAAPVQDTARRLLVQILREGARAPLTEERLATWVGAEGKGQALQLLYRLQRLDFVQGSEAPKVLPEDNLETMLPEILARLSDSGRALLADDNGFYVACAGFRHESAEEIAALAGDILGLSSRHALLLKNNLNISSSAWAISDPAGRSELGFFPLYLGKQSFVLILGGAPQLQSDDFVMLIQALIHRYS
ncbi:MAG: hypothetical protein PHQ14_10745 [Chromatiales bacterium]|jgi:hypothetical protein|nr:hypothetical protein [Chromatiales bacterium]